MFVNKRRKMIYSLILIGIIASTIALNVKQLPVVLLLCLIFIELYNLNHTIKTSDDTSHKVSQLINKDNNNNQR